MDGTRPMHGMSYKAGVCPLTVITATYYHSHYIVSFRIKQTSKQKSTWFLTSRSCLSQLLTHFDRIMKHLEEGKNVDVLYLDFAKAFDKVDF